MKKLLIATLVVTGSVVAANAQEVTKDSAAVTSTTSTTVTSSSEGQEEGVTVVKSEELPDGVKKALESQDFKGWIINSASYNTKDEKYEVELKNGAETKKVRFNKEGQPLND